MDDLGMALISGLKAAKTGALQPVAEPTFTDLQLEINDFR
jgi:hypothetical protein